MSSRLALLFAATGFCALAACVDPTHEPSPLITAPAPTGGDAQGAQVPPRVATGSGNAYLLEQTVRARPTGAATARTLKQGTTWIEVGTIAQGTVYRPVDQTLVVAGFDVSEAYIVVRDGNVVGFWLPVQKAFTPVNEPKPIALKLKEDR